jgi:NADPH:quinone reductase-like Zn-dependent oxidoreductase
MKAVVYDRYGPPEVLRLAEVETPVPDAGEVLVKVVTTTVTSADWRVRSMIVPPGYGLLARLAFGLFRPKRRILGTELAGEVVSLGLGVTGIQPGDAVIGFPGLEFGCYVEYRTVDTARQLVRKPETLSFAEAAALGFGGATALYFLRRGEVCADEKVLIVGASGDVGSAAVQLARHFGAEVTGVCSTANLDLVASIGATRVIDYTREDFTQGAERYDVIFDTVGARSVAESRRVLAPGGRLLLAAGSIVDEMLRAPLSGLFGGAKVIACTAEEDPEALHFLAGLAEAGAFRPVIDRTYPIERIAEAHAYVGTGRKRGSVVITVGGEPGAG